MEEYLKVNKETWNNKVDIHYKSDFYQVDSFIDGATSLNTIELEFLTNLKQKSILHLQCHFGQDTISLNRLGAEVLGVDFSDKAIKKAKELAKITNSTAEFFCSDILSLKDKLDQKFDIVFTSYGTIGWLPDIQKWADTVSHFLKPNGKFVFAEFHPIVWMYDDDFTHIKYPYFKSEPIVEMEDGTYAETKADLKQKCITWNYGLAEVMTSLLKAGLEIKKVREYDYSPYNCFAQTEEFEKGKFRIKPFKNNIPMVYSLEAIKK